MIEHRVRYVKVCTHQALLIVVLGSTLPFLFFYAANQFHCFMGLFLIMYGAAIY